MNEKTIDQIEEEVLSTARTPRFAVDAGEAIA